MASEVTIGSALTQQQKTGAAQNKLAEDFSQFLTLLTIQLQNQDPLSPMDTTEFTNQLVAFTGVEQQINTNQKLDNLVALGLSNSLSASQSYVGKDISYVSSDFDFTGAPTTIKYSLDSAAVVAKVNVYNEYGEVVYTTDASKTAGVSEFTWDGTLKTGGKAIPGTYQIKIDALDVNEDPVKATTVVTGNVRGTESQDGQIFLLVGERAVPLGSVLNTNQPGIGSSNSTAALTSALTYVGMDVKYINSQIDFDGATPTPVTYSLSKIADRAQLLVFNDSGEVVYNANVPKQKGDNSFTWNGMTNQGTMAPAGQYNFVIDAIDSEDARIGTTSVASGNVSGIETKNGQIFLNIGNRTVALNNVIGVNVAIPDQT